MPLVVHTHTHTHTHVTELTYTWRCLMPYKTTSHAAVRHSRHHYGLPQCHIWQRMAQRHISNTTTLSAALLSFSFWRHKDILGHDAVLIKWCMEIRVRLKRTVPHLNKAFTAQWLLYIPHAVRKIHLDHTEYLCVSLIYCYKQRLYIWTLTDWPY
jgi:hypothetical protein